MKGFWNDDLKPFEDAPKTDLPPMLAGDDREEDENDPVWLKDKGDQLMVRGDYQGAYHAYTEARMVIQGHLGVAFSLPLACF